MIALDVVLVMHHVSARMLTLVMPSVIAPKKLVVKTLRIRLSISELLIALKLLVVLCQAVLLL